VGLLYGSLLFANTMKMWGSMDEKLKITDFFDCALISQEGVVGQ